MEKETSAAQIGFELAEVSAETGLQTQMETSRHWFSTNKKGDVPEVRFLQGCNHQFPPELTGIKIHCTGLIIENPTSHGVIEATILGNCQSNDF